MRRSMADNNEVSGSGAGGGDENNQWLSMLVGDPQEMHEADDEMEETPDEMEETHHQDGNETSGTGGEGTSGSEATRKRKTRCPNQLGTNREEITEVDPKSGVPIAPFEHAKTFGNQIGCIV